MSQLSSQQPSRLPAILRYSDALVLVSLGILVQIAVFAVGGVRFGSDSGRYLGAGRALLAGHWPAGKARSYLGYDFFVGLFQANGLGPTALVAVQAAMAVCAGYCLYLLGRRFYGRRAGILACIAYLAYIDVQRWNFYVLTDGLFASMLVIAVFLILRAQRWPWLVGGLLASVFAMLLRPNGVIVPAALVIFGLYMLWDRRAYRTLALALGVLAVVGAVGVNAVDFMAARQHVLARYLDGTVVWGFPQGAITFTDKPPACGDGGAMRQIACFAAERPGDFLRLTLSRLEYFFAHTRPYYSTRHNVFLWLTLIPAYVLALVGIIRPGPDRAQRLLPAAVCGFQALVAALTFADWDGRHLMAVLPLIFLFSAGGVDWVWSVFRARGAGRAGLSDA